MLDIRELGVEKSDLLTGVEEYLNQAESRDQLESIMQSILNGGVGLIGSDLFGLAGAENAVDRWLDNFNPGISDVISSGRLSGAADMIVGGKQDKRTLRDREQSMTTEKPSFRASEKEKSRNQTNEVAGNGKFPETPKLKSLASSDSSDYTENKGERFMKKQFGNLYSPYQDVWDAVNERQAAQYREQNEELEAAYRAAYGLEPGDHIQGQLNDIVADMRFGNSTVGKSGCGCVAIYNALCDMGRTDISLSDLIYLADANGYMMAGGQWGIMPWNLSNLMDDVGIEHTEVYPYSLQINAIDGNIEDGQVFVVSSWNTEDDPGDGMHHYEIVYNAEDPVNPWVVYNRFGSESAPVPYPTVEAILSDEDERDQIITIYQVEVS